jgi:hypothetical protein
MASITPEVVERDRSSPWQPCGMRYDRNLVSSCLQVVLDQVCPSPRGPRIGTELDLSDSETAWGRCDTRCSMFSLLEGTSHKLDLIRPDPA